MSDTKRCTECGAKTTGVIMRDPMFQMSIYVDSVCESCIEEILNDLEKEIVHLTTPPESIDAVNALPDFVEDIEPPLGWDGSFKRKEEINEEYRKFPGRGGRPYVG